LHSLATEISKDSRRCIEKCAIGKSIMREAREAQETIERRKTVLEEDSSNISLKNQKILYKVNSRYKRLEKYSDQKIRTENQN